MGEVLSRKIEQRIWASLPNGAGEDFVDAFETFCLQQGISRPCSVSWSRFLRGQMTVGVIPLPEFELKEMTRLEKALRTFTQSEKPRSEQAT